MYAAPFSSLGLHPRLNPYHGALSGPRQVLCRRGAPRSQMDKFALRLLRRARSTDSPTPVPPPHVLATSIRNASGETEDGAMREWDPCGLCAADECRRVKVGRTRRGVEGMGREAQARARPAGLRTPPRSVPPPSSPCCPSCRRWHHAGADERCVSGVREGRRGGRSGEDEAEFMGREHSYGRAHVPWGCACFHAPSLPRLSVHPRPVVIHATKDGTMRASGQRVRGLRLSDSALSFHAAEREVIESFYFSRITIAHKASTKLWRTTGTRRDKTRDSTRGTASSCLAWRKTPVAFLVGKGLFDSSGHGFGSEQSSRFKNATNVKNVAFISSSDPILDSPRYAHVA
ncbi:hypothetical protein B0H13DRAFT_1903598 [Mycena leptocephala]|nr:hypothetical protein B0H13DRAFT_1903598 [Mycena leptocephala]